MANHPKRDPQKVQIEEKKIEKTQKNLKKKKSQEKKSTLDI